LVLFEVAAQPIRCLNRVMWPIDFIWWRHFYVFVIL